MIGYDTGILSLSKGMFVLMRVQALFFAFLWLIPLTGARAASWKLDLLGGISAPTPGVATLTQACTKIYNDGCLGFSYFASRNELIGQHVVQSGQHLNGTLEHAFRLGDEYHLFYLQI